MRKERRVCGGEETDGNLLSSMAVASALEQRIYFNFFACFGNIHFAELLINIKILEMNGGKLKINLPGNKVVIMPVGFELKASKC